MVRILFVLICIGSLAASAQARVILSDTSAGQAFEVEEVATGLNVPWGMAFVNERALLITQRSGGAVRLNLDTGERRPVQGLPDVAARGQGGLLDVATGPDYPDTGWLYFTYSKATPDGAVTTLARAKLSDTRLTDWTDLLVTRSASGTGRHFGSRIAFDQAGHVFFGVGDRGNRPNGQDLTTHAGALMRLNLDGSIPGDNPFVDRENALPEIWSYGHRNPQGLAYDPATNRLWEIEHGPRGGDEINLIEKGANYGWPVVSHGKEYYGPVDVGEATSKPGMADPVKVYIPSIAPGSLVHYRGEAFPEWRGNLLAGALVLTHLNRVVLNEAGEAVGEERLLESLGERIRDVAVDPEGRLYLTTDSGRLLRLQPAD
ncbi:PQQ-dependent sugar dehydrogenase [Saccharospirillum salsuginis]|uniref:Dehydrogenase n=1 Tax=Saccharospirillum salsuginis TaxID=418750 RepID=A0A918K978_9GAMM|nr:PQQ-dependent sugar dehydrogenase [Saccharospirillum salsuginis]GGX55309.1 dehydrogenase [Saccharospirillum salsuginis]